ncbi:glycosyltransferase [Novosphingobium jiangmenense]|nr:glycosyltransferase [Novosphingobium jiangmenense]
MLEALRELEPNLVVCHRSPWTGIEDKSVLGPRARVMVLLRWLAAYPALLFAYLRAPRHDRVVVPYPGILDVLILYPFARLRGAQICWDMFLSAYDTVVIDRQMLRANGLFARLLYATEWLATRAAQTILLDTREHARYIADLYRLPAARTKSVWVGVESDVFTPARNPPTGKPVKVLFYGQFIPLHGLPVIVEAIRQIAGRLDAPAMEFTIIGTGQEQPTVDAMIKEHQLGNLRRVPWVDYSLLGQKIADASICLGVFAADGKAARVIPNKVFQILAAKRPLVTMDCPAIREIIALGRSIRLVRPGDPSDLADALVALANELCDPAKAAEIHEAAQKEMPMVGMTVVREQLASVLETQ